ncbi:uncharacterized protein LOC134522950 isoform X1 [Chroicocephalus ridibundus]|uniref:uncharacterized protein LOC134522950 isoform X1 n=1 Tax=Chroicocephalus ridibundus TaxID=1192867 RepID=UPI002FDC8493
MAAWAFPVRSPPAAFPGHSAGTGAERVTLPHPSSSMRCAGRRREVRLSLRPGRGSAGAGRGGPSPGYPLARARMEPATPTTHTPPGKASRSPQQTPGGFEKFAAICPNRAAVFSREPGGARGLPQDKRSRSQPRRAPAPAPAPPVRAVGAAAEAGVAVALRACPAPCTALGTHPRSGPRRKIKCLPLMISNFGVWLMACKLPPVPSDLPDEAPWRLVL